MHNMRNVYFLYEYIVNSDYNQNAALVIENFQYGVITCLLMIKQVLLQVTLENIDVNFMNRWNFQSF